MPSAKNKSTKSIGHAGTRYFEVYEERRKRLRFIINRPVEVRRYGGELIHTVAHNISAGGVQLICDRVSAFMVHPGGRHVRSNKEEEMQIRLGLPLASRIEFLEARCRVGYIAIARDVGVAFGMTFEQIIGDGEDLLNAFLQESLDPPPIWIE